MDDNDIKNIDSMESTAIDIEDTAKQSHSFVTSEDKTDIIFL